MVIFVHIRRLFPGAFRVVILDSLLTVDLPSVTYLGNHNAATFIRDLVDYTIVAYADAIEILFVLKFLDPSRPRAFDKSADLRRHADLHVPGKLPELSLGAGSEVYAV